MTWPKAHLRTPSVKPRNLFRPLNDKFSNRLEIEYIILIEQVLSADGPRLKRSPSREFAFTRYWTTRGHTFASIRVLNVSSVSGLVSNTLRAPISELRHGNLSVGLFLTGLSDKRPWVERDFHGTGFLIVEAAHMPSSSRIATPPTHHLKVAMCSISNFRPCGTASMLTKSKQVPTSAHPQSCVGLFGTTTSLI